MNTYEITTYPADLLIDIENEYGRNHLWLGAVLDQQVEWVEKFMCEENAKEVRQTLVVLRQFADDLEKCFEDWKRKEFVK